MKETHWLSSKLPLRDACIPILDERDKLIRSELSKINASVKTYDNWLRKKLGTDYPGAPFFEVKSYTNIKGSERLLEDSFIFG